MSEIDKANDAPTSDGISKGFSKSAESGVITTCTSFLNPFGNMGRIGRSISLHIKIESLPGLPSLLKNPPGIFPRAYILSENSTVNGKKSTPSLGSLIVAVTSNEQSP